MEQKPRKFLRSLRGKLAVQTIAIGIIPIIVIGTLGWYRLNVLTQDVGAQLDQSRNELAEQVVGANLATTAAHITGQIDFFMRERISDTIVWTNAPVVIEAARRGRKLHEAAGFDELDINEVEAKFPEAKSLGQFTAADDYLKQQIQASSHFGEVFFTDARGFNVGLTNPTSDFVQFDEDWWQGAWESGIYISDVEYDDSAGIWAVEISVRIDDPFDSESVGVMKTVLGVSLIQEISSTAAAEIRAAQVSIVNASGLLLAETDSEHSLSRIMKEEANLTKTGAAPIKEAILGEAARGFNISERSVIGFARSAGGDYYGKVAWGFNGFDWLAVIELPHDVAFAPIAGLETVRNDLHDSTQTLLITLGLVIVAVLIIAASLANLIARSVTIPILELRNVADRVSRNDTSQPVLATSDDEVGDLARDFERMRKSLEVAMRRLRRMT